MSVLHLCRLEASPELQELQGVHALLDLLRAKVRGSPGCHASLQHLCRASGVLDQVKPSGILIADGLAILSLR